MTNCLNSAGHKQHRRGRLGRLRSRQKVLLTKNNIRKKYIVEILGNEWEGALGQMLDVLNSVVSKRKDRDREWPGRATDFMRGKLNSVGFYAFPAADCSLSWIYIHRRKRGSATTGGICVDDCPLWMAQSSPGPDLGLA